MVPADFPSCLEGIRARLAGVDGWLSDREMAFLALVAACPTARGEVLEIGSFRGRSTIALAIAAQLARDHRAGDQPATRIVAVDPMRDDDPLLDAPLVRGTARAVFEQNLRRAGVTDWVEFHQAFSYDFARRWRRPLRLLWIDGDHSYRSTKQDYDLFAPYLADGAILAMHDVLSPYEGCIRVFLEDVLDSPHIAAAGVCGSIGWAQYWHTPRASSVQTAEKHRLSARLRRLLPYHCATGRPRGWSKLRYRWLRSRVPHQALEPADWARTVASAI